MNEITLKKSRPLLGPSLWTVHFREGLPQGQFGRVMMFEIEVVKVENKE
jgi:hypothetical protein